MSGTTPDSPVVSRAWCPGCEPSADPLRQILEVQYCDRHVPSREGVEDGAATTGGTFYAGGEAGGDANRAWCALVHRERREP